MSTTGASARPPVDATPPGCYCVCHNPAASCPSCAHCRGENSVGWYWRALGRLLPCAACGGSGLAPGALADGERCARCSGVAVDPNRLQDLSGPSPDPGPLPAWVRGVAVGPDGDVPAETRRRAIAWVQERVTAGAAGVADVDRVLAAIRAEQIPTIALVSLVRGTSAARAELRAWPTWCANAYAVLRARGRDADQDLHELLMPIDD
jgi:hypothetical protein